MTLSVAPGLSRAYTFVLQLTVLISLAALVILIADVQSDHGAIGNETLARTLAKVGAQEVSGALLRARMVLADISATPLPILLKSGDPCASALAGHLVGRGDFSNLFLMTASGAVICAANTEPEFALTDVQNERLQLAVHGDAFSQSQFSTGRSTGGPMLFAMQRISNSEGTPVGLVALAIGPIKTQSLLRNLALPMRANLSFESAAGAAVRAPGDADTSAGGARTFHLFHLSDRAPSKSTATIVGTDWRVTAVISNETTFAAVERVAIEAIFILLILAIVMMLAAPALARQIDRPMSDIARVSAIANRVVADALDSRVGPGDPEKLAEIEQQLKVVMDARDLAEHKLRISEGRFQSLADASPIGIFRTNKRGQAVYANRRWHEIVGMQPENSRDGGWINGVHPDDRESVLRDWAESTENALPFKRDYRFQDKEGRVIWVRADAVVQKGNDGVATGYIGTVTDITASLLVEEASRADAARFQALSSRILETQEAERRHIAHELHDEVGQALTAIKISMRSLARHIPTAHRSTLEQAITTTDGTLAMVRGLTLDLRPPQLDHLGLVAALAWHVETRSDMSGLHGHFSADPQIERLRPDIETICFRIAQEATTNVTRHANAQNLWVELRLLGVALVLIIRDDGDGFDIAEGQRRALHGGSLGLLGMEERAAQVGGHFEIESRKHSGTTVRAIFPVVWAKPRTRAEQRASI